MGTLRGSSTSLSAVLLSTTSQIRVIANLFGARSESLFEIGLGVRSYVMGCWGLSFGADSLTQFRPRL